MFIGILGGTFDPPHNGHLALARAALGKLRLHRVIFVPARIPPHKNAAAVSSAGHRLRMLQLCLGDNEEFEISEVELKRRGPSYTVDTITGLQKRYPRDEFCFLLGADNVSEIESWYRPERIFQRVRVAAVNRPGFEPSGKFASNILYFDMEPVAISSTLIREKIKAGDSISGLVPAAVENYIKENRLYQ